MPDLSALPAAGAGGDGALDRDPALAEGVEAFTEVFGAEMAPAEGAFHRGMRTAGFDAAKAGAVAGGDDAAVVEMCDKVIAAGAAGLPGTDGFVVLEVIGVG